MTRGRLFDQRQSGRGFLGFLFALVVVGIGVVVAKEYWTVKHKYTQINTFTYDTIRSADRRGLKEDGVQFEIYKKCRELKIPIKDSDAIKVDFAEGNRLRVRFEWKDTVAVPYYPVVQHYVVEQTWTRY